MDGTLGKARIVLTQIILGLPLRRALPKDLGAGGGVRFARLLHPGAHEALEIFLAWHRHVSVGYTTGVPPAVHAVTPRNDDTDPGVFPPLPHTGLRLGRSLERLGVDRRHPHDVTSRKNRQGTGPPTVPRGD